MLISARTCSLMFVMAALGGLYLYLDQGEPVVGQNTLAEAPNDQSASLPLEDDVKAKIRGYIESISLDTKENSLKHAIQLDHSIGRVQMSQGNYRGALETYKKVLAISYRQGSLMGVGIGLMVIADLAERSGDLTEARYATFLAYKTALALKNPEEIGVAQLAIARRFKDEDPSLSMLWLARAKESLEGSRYQEDYIRVLSGLAAALRKLHEDDSASALYEEAWKKVQSLGNASSQKPAKWEVGIDYADDLVRRKQYEKAGIVLRVTESYYSPAEKTSDNYISVLSRRARIYSLLNQRSEAALAYLTAYGQLELARANAIGDAGRTQLDSNYRWLVDGFVDHYVRANDPVAAIALLETNKARMLSHVIEDPMFQKAQGAWKALQLVHAAELNSTIESGELAQRNSVEQTIAGVLSILTRHRRDAEKLQVENGLKGTTAMADLSKEKLERIQRQLSEDTAVLSFFLGQERTIVFVVTKQGSRHVVLSNSAKEYQQAAAQLLVSLANPHNDFYREPAQFLYRELLAPVIRVLPSSIKVILYSPDGPLWTIPLSVLMHGENFVAERFSFYEVRSLRLIESLRSSRQPPAGLVACVNPDIKGVELPSEASTTLVLENHYGGKGVILSGAKCTKSNVVSALDRSSGPLVLHLGVPGNLYTEDPMDAALMLSGDGQGPKRGEAWSAKEIALTDMSKVDLLTLNHSEARIARIGPDWNREALGLLRPLFFSGVKQVLAPRWQVRADASVDLLQAFHRSYAQNYNAPLALQNAQASVRRNDKYSHPHFWSAFTLTVGNQ